MPSQISQVTRILQAVADPNRLRILKCLQIRPCCVCELVQATGIPQSRVSRHLKVLRDAGLVTNARDAQWVEYSIARAQRGTPEPHLLTLIARWLEEDEQVMADRKRLATASREQFPPVPGPFGHQLSRAEPTVRLGPIARRHFSGLRKERWYTAGTILQRFHSRSPLPQ